jgi:hypothetical protein
MTRAKTLQILMTLLALGMLVGAYAQGTGDTSINRTGTARTGTAVKTGHGPLSRPIPPAVSTLNQQQQYPQHPQSIQGPTQTNPPQQPFGSK